MDDVAEIDVIENGPETTVRGTGTLDLSNAQELRRGLVG